MSGRPDRQIRRLYYRIHERGQQIAHKGLGFFATQL